MSNKRLKILYRKNLNMSAGKLAAQAVHAALLLNGICDDVDDLAMSVVVLGVSNAKFEQAKNDIEGHKALIQDAGYTEIPSGTETCLAFVEDDPRLSSTEK